MAKKTKTIQEDIKEEYEELVKKFDKIFKEYFGKMCPEFQQNCFQCRINLIYNKFKKELFDEYVGDK